MLKNRIQLTKLLTLPGIHLQCNRRIDGEDFVNFCGLLRKHELYSVQALFS